MPFWTPARRESKSFLKLARIVRTNLPMVTAQKLFPSRALMLLLAIGFIDLVATAVLHSMGLIIEVNPLMRVFIERSEWLFCLVKGSTLVIAWYFMRRYWSVSPGFVRQACLVGSGCYVAIWSLVFFGSLLA